MMLQDCGNQETAISIGLAHQDLQLNNAVLHSRMVKMPFSVPLFAYCFQSQEPVGWLKWVSMHLAFTPKLKKDT